MSVEVRESKRSARTLRCPFCHESVGPEETGAACSTCRAQHHVECFAEGGGCAACRGRSRLRVRGSFGRRVRWLARQAARAVFVVALACGLYVGRAGLFVKPQNELTEMAASNEIDPRTAVEYYLQVSGACPSGGALTEIATSGTLDVLELEGFEAERDFLGSMASHGTTGVHWTSFDRATVLVGGREKVDVVREADLWPRRWRWLVDRVLADEPVETCGASLRLPVRLALDRPNRWSCGTLSARIERESYDKEPTTRRGSKLEYEFTGAQYLKIPNQRRWRKMIFVGGDEHESCIHAFVDLRDGDLPIHYELHGPPGRVREIERVMNASLSTLRSLTVPASETPRADVEGLLSGVFETEHAHGTYELDRFSPRHVFEGESLAVRVFEVDAEMKRWIDDGKMPEAAIALLKEQPSRDRPWHGWLDERFDSEDDLWRPHRALREDPAPDGKTALTLVAWGYADHYPQRLAVAMRARATGSDRAALRQFLDRMLRDVKIEAVWTGSRSD